MKYGIVGAGYFGLEFARILRNIPGAELTAIYSPDDANGADDDISFTLEPSVEALIDAVDAVIIASPNHVHRGPAVLAAEAGKHVFCEKPVALSYADCDAMVRSSEAAGTIFLAGHVLHFMPGIQKAFDLTDGGAIGSPVVGHAARTGWEDGSTAPSWKKTRSMSGGHLFHHIHELDVMQRFLGPATSVTMNGGAAPQCGPRVGDQDAILLASATFEQSRYATLEWGSVFRRPRHAITIEGTEGYLEIDLQQVTISLHRDNQVDHFPLHSSFDADQQRARENLASTNGSGVTYGNPSVRPPSWLREAMIAEILYFHSLATGEGPVQPSLSSLTDGSAARASIATAEAMMLSLELARTVHVQEITQG